MTNERKALRVRARIDRLLRSLTQTTSVRLMLTLVRTEFACRLPRLARLARGEARSQRRIAAMLARSAQRS